MECRVCGGFRLTDQGVCRPANRGAPEPLDLPWPLSLLQCWPPSHSIALSGGPGSGKSTLAAMAGQWWGDRLGSFDWITSEQTGAEVGAMMARVIPRWAGRVDVYPARGLPAWRQAISSVSAPVIILDSVSAIAGYEEQVQVLRDIDDWMLDGPERRALVIQQVNGLGQAAGKLEIPHLVDATAQIDKLDGLRVLRVSKNRAGPIGNCYFAIDAAGVRAIDFARGASYSVEGEPGEYTLHAYPLPRARWAGLLQKMDEQGNMRPGLASSAIPVPGYPDGVLQPIDLAERRAFALAHGLTWLEPSTIPDEDEA